MQARHLRTRAPRARRAGGCNDGVAAPPERSATPAQTELKSRDCRNLARTWHRQQRRLQESGRVHSLRGVQGRLEATFPLEEWPTPCARSIPRWCMDPEGSMARRPAHFAAHWYNGAFRAGANLPATCDTHASWPQPFTGRSFPMASKLHWLNHSGWPHNGDPSSRPHRVPCRR